MSECRGITYNEYNGNIYVTNSVTGTVSVIDEIFNTVIDTIDIFDNDNNLTGITETLNSNKENVYVAKMYAGSIFSTQEYWN